jgi:hypothetical protein
VLVFFGDNNKFEFSADIDEDQKHTHTQKNKQINSMSVNFCTRNSFGVWCVFFFFFEMMLLWLQGFDFLWCNYWFVKMFDPVVSFFGIVVVFSL